MSPATNIVTMAKANMPYRPEPTPPKVTSPSAILAINTIPPNGRKLSCIASTAPPASVVTVAKSADGVMP